MFIEIGRLYYDEHHGAPDGRYAQLFEELEAMDEKIEAMREELEAAKAAVEAAKASGADVGDSVSYTIIDKDSSADE